MTEKIKIVPTETEKVFIALPNGIAIGLESAKQNLNQMNDVVIQDVNNILEFENNLKNKSRSYLG